MSLATGLRAVFRRLDDRTFRLVVFTACCVLVLATFLCRLRAFQNTEPRIDQAAGARVVREVASAQHVLPSPRSQGWRHAIEEDQSSSVHWLARYMAPNPHFLLTLEYLVAHYALVQVFGSDYRVYVITSIAASCAAIGAVFAWAFVIMDWRNHRARAAFFALLAASLLATAAYANLYSPWGAHNAGVFGLVAGGLAATVAIRRWQTDARIERATVLILVASVLVSFYAHWTNVLLLPPATVLAIAANPRITVAKKFRLIGAYAAICAIAVLPAMAVALAARSSGTTMQYAAMSAWSARATLARGVRWFTASAEYFSIWGLLAGIVGAAYIAFRDRVYIPICLCFAHFAVTVLVPGFTWNGSATESRTYNYLIPVLCLGIASVVVALFRSETGFVRIVAVATACLVAAHVAGQIRRDADLAAAGLAIPSFRPYVEGQGEWRKISSYIDQTAPSASVLVTQDYPIQDAYAVLSSKDLDLPRPLENLAQQGPPPGFADRFKGRCSQFFILGADDVDSVARLTQKGLADVVPSCPAMPSAQRLHSFDAPWYGEKLALFSVRFEDKAAD